MNTASFIEEIDAATALLKKAVAAFSAEQFREAPGGKWSAALIVEHLLLVESSINKLFDLKGEEAGRLPSKKTDLIVMALGDDEKKFNSPEMHIPSGKYPDVSVVEDLAVIRTQIKEKALATNPDEMITIKHPALGLLTRLEWIQFLIHHSNRHARQIQMLSHQLNQVRL